MSYIETYNEAVAGIDQLNADADEHHSTLAAIRANKDLSAAAKTRTIQEATDALLQKLRTVPAAIEERLERADRGASLALSGNTESDQLEMRKQRAGSRVVRLLAAGQTPGQVAQLLADTNDIDGYRALRDEIPAHIATLDLEVNKRAEAAAQLLEVDRAMAPVLVGGMAQAARVRLEVDGQRARLNAVTIFAVEPTANARLRLGFANSTTN